MASFIDEATDAHRASIEAPQAAVATAQPQGFMQELNQPPAASQGQQEQQLPPPNNGIVPQPLVSFAQGINSVVGKIPQNVAIGAGKLGDEIGLTQGAGAGQQQQAQQTAMAQQQDMNASPMAGAAGQAAGTAGMVLPQIAAPAKALVQGGLGAAQGYLGTDPQASVGEHLGNAALGAVAGAGGTAAGNLIGKVAQGAKVMFRDPADLASNAMKNAMDRTGGDVTSVTPSNFFQQVSDNLKNITGQKNQLYANRNAIADAEGIQANVGDLKDSINFYSKNSAFTHTMDGKAVLNNLKKSDTLPYAQAQTLSDLVGQNAYKVKNSDPALSRELNGLKQGIQSRINTAGGSQQLQDASTTADQFYNQQYRPMRGIDADNIIQNHLAESQYMAGALKGVMQNPQALQALGQDGRQMLMKAHTDALHTAAIDPVSGDIDTGKYVKSLGASLKQNPQLYNEVVPNLKALTDSLGAAQAVAKGQTGHNVPAALLGFEGGREGYERGGVSGAIAGAAGGIVAGKILPKIPFMYRAGKLLQNPDARQLLQRYTQLGENGADPAVQKMVGNRISDFWKKIPGMGTTAAISSPSGNPDSQ